MSEPTCGLPLSYGLYMGYILYLTWISTKLNELATINRSGTLAIAMSVKAVRTILFVTVVIDVV